MWFEGVSSAEEQFFLVCNLCRVLVVVFFETTIPKVVMRVTRVSWQMFWALQKHLSQVFFPESEIFPRWSFYTLCKLEDNHGNCNFVWYCVQKEITSQTITAYCCASFMALASSSMHQVPKQKLCENGFIGMGMWLYCWLIDKYIGYHWLTDLCWDILLKAKLLGRFVLPKKHF